MSGPNHAFVITLNSLVITFAKKPLTFPLTCDIFAHPGRDSADKSIMHVQNRQQFERSVMADVERGSRPLSPHLQVYKWPVNMGMSIFHRMTGVAVGVVVALISLWFFALAWSPEAFAWADWLITSWLGWLVLLGGAASLWFHFVNGIRHLVWDTGSSFGQKRVRRTALTGIGVAGVLTLVTIWVAIAV